MGDTHFVVISGNSETRPAQLLARVRLCGRPSGRGIDHGFRNFQNPGKHGAFLRGIGDPSRDQQIHRGDAERLHGYGGRRALEQTFQLTNGVHDGRSRLGEISFSVDNVTGTSTRVPPVAE